MSGQRNLAASLDRLAAALEAQERRERERLEHDRRTADYRRIGHKSEPRRLQLIDFVRAAPGFMAQFKRVVPGEFWALDNGIATVSCPCGQDPMVAPGAATCECGRAYLFTGREVRVAFSPVEPSGDPAA